MVPVLADALGDENSTVGSSAAVAVARMGLVAAGAEPQLLGAIAHRALHDYPRLLQLVAALRAISPDPRAKIKDHFAGTDGEVRRLGARRPPRPGRLTSGPGSRPGYFLRHTRPGGLEHLHPLRVQFHVPGPLVRHVGVQEDGPDRALGDSRPAVDAVGRVDVELPVVGVEALARAD